MFRHIPSFLQKYQKLPLPELGCITLERQPSGIHYGEGTLRPPVYKIVFQEDKNTIAGIYDFYWHQFTGSDVFGAPTDGGLDKLSREIRHAVNRDEVLTIGDLIRFYKDDKGAIRFKALNTMLPEEMFGLPELNYFPVSREKPKEAISAQQRAIPKKKRKPVYTLKTVWASAIVLLLLIGVISVVNYVNENQLFNAIQVADERNERLNKRPADITDVHAYSPAERTPAAPVDDEMQPATEGYGFEEDNGVVGIETSEDPVAEVVPGETVAEADPVVEELEVPVVDEDPDTNFDGPVIFIELLCNQANVSRLLSNIEQEGYVPFSRPRGRCTQVGIYAGSVNSDTRHALRIIKERYNPDAFLE